MKAILPVSNLYFSGVHMGIALLSFVDLLSPLQSLANRWMPKGRSRRVSTAGLRYVGIRPSCSLRQGAASARTVADVAQTPARPLRVVRMVDAQQPGRHASRMVISGRMADVCAEIGRAHV